MGRATVCVLTATWIIAGQLTASCSLNPQPEIPLDGLDAGQDADPDPNHAGGTKGFGGSSPSGGASGSSNLELPDGGCGKDGGDDEDSDDAGAGCQPDDGVEFDGGDEDGGCDEGSDEDGGCDEGEMECDASPCEERSRCLRDAPRGRCDEGDTHRPHPPHHRASPACICHRDRGESG